MYDGARDMSSLTIRARAGPVAEAAALGIDDEARGRRARIGRSVDPLTACVG
jgi:hypothetical protein